MCWLECNLKSIPAEHIKGQPNVLVYDVLAKQATVNCPSRWRSSFRLRNICKPSYWSLSLDLYHSIPRFLFWTAGAEQTDSLMSPLATGSLLSLSTYSANNQRYWGNWDKKPWSLCPPIGHVDPNLIIEDSWQITFGLDMLQQESQWQPDPEWLYLAAWKLKRKDFKM